MYNILANPVVLQRVRDEIDKVLQHRVPTYDDLLQLPYLENVVQETLRVNPPVPAEMKMAAQDDELPDGSRVVKGANILFCPYTMGRDETRWGPTAKEFNPDRWDAMEEKPTPYEMPVFQAGPRICPGRQMALVETKLLMCRLLQQFEFQLELKHAPEYEVMTVLVMKGGLPVRVTRRVFA